MLNKQEKELQKKYTRIKKFDCGWTCFLQVEGQGFQVVGSTSKSRAKWYSEMLAKAIRVLIEKENIKNEE